MTTRTPDTEYRDFVVDGVSASGRYEPQKLGIRELLNQMMTGASLGAKIFSTKALMDASNTPADDQMAWVVADTTHANNGIYGADDGDYTRLRGLPDGIAVATNVAGTANDVTADTQTGVDPSEVSLLVIVPALGNTSTTMTLRLNDGDVEDWTSASGAGPAVGSVLADVGKILFRVGSEWRDLFSSAASATLDFQGDWDSGTTYTQSQFVMHGFILYYNTSATTINEEPGVADPDPWLVVTDFGGVAPPIVANTMLVDDPSGSLRESKTFDEVKELLDPDSDLLRGQGLRLTYHMARGKWHVKAFGSSLTDIGTGSASADTAALQAALDSEEMIDITGADLSINDIIDVDYIGAHITASGPNTRVGTAGASRITVTDTAQTKLFNVSAQDFEASGFRVNMNGNTVGTAFHFEKTAGSYSDMDASLSQMTIWGGAKAFHHFGRGLNLDGIIFIEQGTCVGDYDFDNGFTPNGSSTDLLTTGMRAHTINNCRVHGSQGGFRNIGPNKLNMHSLSVSGVYLDIGGGTLFEGVWRDASFVNIRSHLNALIGNKLFDFHAGSSNCSVSNFFMGGYYDGVNNRLSRNCIAIAADATNETRDLKFLGGTFGPCTRDAVTITGEGSVHGIYFDGVNFDNIGIDGAGYSPINITESGGGFSTVDVKLNGCSARYPVTTPNYVVRGTNSANYTIYNMGGNTFGVTMANTNVVVSTS